jgi:hypothetical protein
MVTLLIFFFVKKTIRKMNCGVMTKEVKMNIRKLLILNMKIIVTVKDKRRNGREVTMKMMTVTSQVVEEVEYSERDMIINGLTMSRREWISHHGESLLS